MFHNSTRAGRVAQRSVALVAFVGFPATAQNMSEVTAPAASAMADHQSSSTSQSDATGVEEIVVTASRREEFLSQVPISVAAVTQKSLDQQGIRNVTDLTRTIPNIQASGGSRGAGPRNIAIRGIASDVGARTTGIYIDDTPLQVRTVGQGPEKQMNSYPQLFDLERVEVLRGPQGTLFGAGAQGGVIRFITPQPSLTDFSGYARAEIASTQSGGLSGEVGLAAGGPIVDGVLALRASAWYRRDGGYVDNVDYLTGQLVERNANHTSSRSFKLSASWQPAPNLLITPSVFHQIVSEHDTDDYWVTLSNRGKHDFVDATPGRTSDRDEVTLPALRIEWDLGPVQLISNSSYLIRNNDGIRDLTIYGGSLVGVFYPTSTERLIQSVEGDSQRNFTQELRAQSSNPDSRFSWVAGLFYSRSRQVDYQRIGIGDLENILQQRFGASIADVFGESPYQGRYIFYLDLKSRDTQYAAYAQGDYKLTPKLTATAGLRVTRAEFNFHTANLGPFNHPGVIFGDAQGETPVTPKFALSYQATDDQLFYVSAAKGFRPGGGQEPVPFATCADSLNALGYDSSPTTYKSDSLWSYEAGTKTSLMGGRVQIDTSGFYIKWSNVQRPVFLASCGLTFVGNLGSVTSKGIDLAARIRVLRGLHAAVSIAYTDATYDEDILSGTEYVARKGEPVINSPWSISASIDYRFALSEFESYARADLQYTGRSHDIDPLSLEYDPAIPAAKALTTVNARAGIVRSGFDVSIFVNNLFNASPEILSHATLDSPLFRGSAYRPRTAGLTVTSRF